MGLKIKYYKTKIGYFWRKPICKPESIQAVNLVWWICNQISIFGPPTRRVLRNISRGKKIETVKKHL